MESSRNWYYEGMTFKQAFQIASDLDHIFLINWEEQRVIHPPYDAPPTYENTNINALEEIIWQRLIELDSSFQYLSPTVVYVVKRTIGLCFQMLNFEIRKSIEARKCPTFVGFIVHLDYSLSIDSENIRTEEDRKFIEKLRSIVREIERQVQTKSKMN